MQLWRVLAGVICGLLFAHTVNAASISIESTEPVSQAAPKSAVLKVLHLPVDHALPVTVHAIVLKNDDYRAQLYIQPSGAIAWLNEVVAEHKATVGINAGFFMKNFAPNGLVLINGKTYAKAKHNRLLSALISINKAGQVRLQGRKGLKTLQQSGDKTALQVGPVLIERGEIAVKKNAKYHRRTVLALSANGNLIILRTSSASLYDIAAFLKQQAALLLGQGDKVVMAVNCDGGSSSSLMVNRANKPLYLPENVPVRTMLLFTVKADKIKQPS